MKRALAVPICLIGLWLGGLNAMAGGPERVPAPIPDPLTFNCPNFTMRATFPANQQYALIFTYPDGSAKLIFTGRLVVTFTNLSNNKSLTANISGPAVNTFNADGSLVFVMNGLSSDGFSVSAGHIVITVTATGDATFSMVGHMFVDLCSALA